MPDEQRALLIYVEPTPYVLGTIGRLIARHTAPVEALFVTANLTQPWNLALHDVPAFALPARPFAAAREIAKRIATRRYGVVHLAGWGHPALLWALVVAWRCRVPVFMESDTPLPANSPLWKRAVRRLAYPGLFRIPRRVLPAGKRQAEYFRYYGVPDDRIVPVHMTVDVTDIMSRSDAARANGRAALRASFGLPENAVVFIYVGRLEARKGLTTLLAAFSRLHDARANAVLLIVGTGSEQPRVEAATRVNAAVRYAGRLDHDAVINAYASADVAVLPSIVEPWGLVVNEAMAAGLPVIVSDRAGCVDDLVTPGETGIVVAAGAMEPLHDAMRDLVDHPARRADMGRAGRQRISGWTLEDQAARIVDAWRARD